MSQETLDSFAVWVACTPYGGHKFKYHMAIFKKTTGVLALDWLSEFDIIFKNKDMLLTFSWRTILRWVLQKSRESILFRHHWFSSLALEH